MTHGDVDIRLGLLLCTANECNKQTCPAQVQHKSSIYVAKVNLKRPWLWIGFESSFGLDAP